jgi:Ca2+-binding EF-hand superfamily protein
MNTARTQLQKITLLASPLILVLAMNGFAQEITLDASGDGTGQTNDEVHAHKVIDQYDKNRDGQLTASEWGEMSNTVRFTTGLSQRIEFLNPFLDVETADGNRDGKITVQEYASWMQSLPYITAHVFGPRVDSFVRRIMSFDRNRDGKLSRDEASGKALFSSGVQHVGSRLSDGVPTRVDFDQADQDRDGIATKDELAAAIMKATVVGKGHEIENMRLEGKAPAPRYQHDSNIIISWSKNNDELRGFSKNSGEWTPLEIPKQAWINPITIKNAAVVQVDNTMVAYSGITGTWDVLQLSNGNNFSLDASDEALFEITDSGRLYIFAAANGKWTSPDDPNLGRSNQLSVDEKEWATRRSDAVSRWNESGVSGAIQLESHNPLVSKEQIDEQLRELTKQYRKDNLPPAQLRSEISKAVAGSFDQRQAYQKAEAARMQQKLKSIQAAITKRETLRERIIARRVDELLDLDQGPESPGTPSPGTLSPASP